MFSEFDNYLRMEFLADYWYDEGMSIASALLLKFDQADWNELRETCNARKKEWPVRCAEALDLADHSSSTDILIGLLASNDDDVVVAAADSLRSKENLELSDKSIERLVNLSKNGSTPVKAVLVNLLKSLK